MKDADTAESLKHWLLHYMPDNEESLADEDATASSLWDRLQLVQLRVQGRRSFFVVVYSRRQQHRLLVLKVQVEGGGVDYTTKKWKLIPLEEREAHARRQSTYQDDEYGSFLPGMRVRWENWLPYVDGEDA